MSAIIILHSPYDMSKLVFKSMVNYLFPPTYYFFKKYARHPSLLTTEYTLRFIISQCR